jgi:hypothetical protein
MRQRFSPQLDLQIIPIEKIILPLRSRDELPPILAGLQWIWTQPALKTEIFVLVEEKILAGKKATGRVGCLSLLIGGLPKTSDRLSVALAALR